MEDELKNLIGRTRLARSPVASPASITAVPSPPSTGLAGPDVEDPGFVEAETPDRLAAIPGATDEGKALLAALRLVDRAGGLQPLSPVERAFVEGAKVTFDRLAKLCKAMLDRKASDSLATIADPRQAPTSTIPPSIVLAAGPKASSKAPRGASKPADTAEA